MICTSRTSDWHGSAFTLSLIGYTFTGEIAVRNSDWLYRLFSHVKIKRIDLYKWVLWNKILVLCVIKHNTYLLLTEFEGPYRKLRTEFLSCKLRIEIYEPRASRLGHKSKGKNEDP